MKVKKAVITAAGPTQRKLPVQTLRDQHGVERSVLELLIDEIVHAGIDDVCPDREFETGLGLYLAIWHVGDYTHMPDNCSSGNRSGV